MLYQGHFTNILRHFRCTPIASHPVPNEHPTHPATPQRQPFSLRRALAFLATTAALTFMLLFGLISPPAHAWGAEGHRIVGLIADEELGPKTRIAVRRILNGNTLADESTWMDEMRASAAGRRMSKWHYVNQALCTTPVQPICSDGNCAPARIEWAVEVLRSGQRSSVPPDQVQTALRVLIHLIADIHQPLHAVDNHDGGGNDVIVTNRSCGSLTNRPGSSCKLHAYWDSTLVKNLTRGASEAQRAHQWSTSFASPSTDSSDPWVWARESHAISRQSVYNFGPSACASKLRAVAASTDYDRRASVIVQQRLTAAGKRLARVLDSIYEH